MSPPVHRRRSGLPALMPLLGIRLAQRTAAAVCQSPVTRPIDNRDAVPGMHVPATPAGYWGDDRPLPPCPPTRLFPALALVPHWSSAVRSSVVSDYFSSRRPPLAALFHLRRLTTAIRYMPVVRPTTPRISAAAAGQSTINQQ